ncbi:AAA family ATPase [Duganella sp. Dugasp56]|uniref:AAA family ATPase n=1 Tax=Duganella sp. Dugasp56 TaxID=3243046 RepID=UPI0039AEBFBE
MKIISYQYSEHLYSYNSLSFKRLNLFVGASGSGKTRLLNTIFNLASHIIQGTCGTSGRWDVLFEHAGKKYRFIFSNLCDVDHPTGFISEESLELIDGSTIEKIFFRDEISTVFKGAVMPKVTKISSVISVFREDPVMSSIIAGFRSIARRSFHGDELLKAPILGELPVELIQHYKKLNKIDWDFFTLPLNLSLLLLERCFKNKFDEIVSRYIGIFPNVKSISSKKAKDIPENLNVGFDSLVMAIKENNVEHWIPLKNVSSGMLKVLLILTDILCLPSDSIYMIDEYENSLGVNAIDFLPDLLLENLERTQFFVTSHHPYLINNIPLKDWFVFGRHGGNVTVKYGSELKERYGLSKQEVFTQLINDPFYLEGRP